MEKYEVQNSIIAIFLPFLHKGGVERAMLNLAQGFVQRGIRVDLVLATKAEGPYVSQIPSQVRVIELKASTPILSFPGLVRYLRRRRPQAVLSGLTPANLVAVWARRVPAMKKTKVIIRVEIAVGIRESTTPLRARLRPFVYKAFYPWADTIVAVSRGVAKDLLRFGIPKTKIGQIYNPVVNSEMNERAKEPVEHPWFAPDTPPVILGVGRLHKQKDFATLIRAFALVRKARPAHLVILGEGEERPHLETLVRNLGLDSEVDLPGFVDNPYKYMARANVFALSSVYEGFGNVIAEALALGIPVVSTDCPSGPAEILEDGKWGILVPPRDPQALAKAILEALDKYWDREALCRRAQAFSVDTIVSQYMEVIGIEG